MADEKRLISADMAKEMIVNHANEFSDVLNRREKALLIGGGTSCIDKCPTVDAVEVDIVAQMLYEAIGDYCPCNFNDNDEWLTLVCDDCNVCGEHDDPLYCWKQYIKHYGERKDNDNN